MYYGFVPNLPNLHTRFSGFTESPYTFQRYKDMMAQFKIQNEILKDEGYERREDCISDMKNIMEFSGTDPSGLFADRNRLFTITGKGVGEKVVVVTDTILEYFHEVFFNRHELYKVFSDFYRLCSQTSVERLYMYFKKTPETEVFINIIKKIHDIWSGNNIAHMSEDELYGPDSLFSIDDNGEMRMWNVVDQAYQLELYIASEIVKNNWIMNERYVESEFYDFDVR